MAQEDGKLSQSYGYDEFGQDLYGNQGKVQPFGYTGYQRDSVAGTYFAQAREYDTERGRFAGQDMLCGFFDMPFTMNRYTYCFNSTIILVDLNGAWPKWAKDTVKWVGEKASNVKKNVENTIYNAGKWIVEHKEDIAKIAITTAVAVSATALTVATVGTAAGVFVGVSAAAGAMAGGITAAMTGGFVGNTTTEIMEGKNDLINIGSKSLVNGAFQTFMTMGGVVTKAFYEAGLPVPSVADAFLNYVGIVCGVGTGMLAWATQKCIELCTE